MFRTKELENRIASLEAEVERIKESSGTPSSLLSPILAFLTSGSVSRADYDSLKEKYHELDKRLSLYEAKKSSCKNCQS